MNRWEELAFKLSDAGLNAAEHSELEQLLAADPAAARGFMALLDVEAGLRADRASLDVSDLVLRGIDTAREERTKNGVLKEINKQLDSGRMKPVLRPRPRPARIPKDSEYQWARWTNFAVAAVVVLMIGVWLYKSNRVNPQPAVAENPNKATTALPVVATSQVEKPPAPAEDFGRVIFSEDFENGLPAGWLCGKAEATGLPPGAKGGVRQIVKPGADHFGIYSNRTQNGKLFDVTSDDWVHLTFKVTEAEPFKLVLALKSAESTFQEGQLEYMIQNTESDWRTLHLPVAKFVNGRSIQDKKSVVCMGYVFQTQQPDIGLTVARFWITRMDSKK